MIPTTRNQIILCFHVAVLIQCLSSASEVRVNSPFGSKISVKKATSGRFIPEDVKIRQEAGSTSVRWHLDSRSLLNRYTKNESFSEFVEYNVTYQLMLTPILDFSKIFFCTLHERIEVDQDPEIDRQECRKEVFSFHVYNMLALNFTTNFDDFCEIQHQTYKVNLRQADVFGVDNLLPHQSYRFKIAHNMKYSNYTSYNLDTQTEPVCTHDGPPQYPPQTDLSSFSVTPEDASGNVKVDLYWRPMPKIFAGSMDITYEVYCEDHKQKVVYTAKIPHITTGKTSLKKASYEGYVCRVRSFNAQGSSSYSPIIIPDRSRLINVGSEFKFYAYAVSNEEYWLEWTPIKFLGLNRTEILSRNATKVLWPSDDGIYTIYWCVAGRAQGCSNLAGIVRTNSSGSFNLVLPPRSEVAPRIFGLSYIHNNPAHSTGIIWSKCVANFENFSEDPLTIMKATSVEGSHTSLSIYWDFPGCDSQVPLIETYEVNYCKIEQLTGCASVWSSFKSGSLDNFKFDHSDCKTISFANKFRNEANITNLEPSSMYMVRLRYILHNNSTNQWTEPKSGTTLADPILVRQCWLKFNWTMIGISLLVILALALCCTKSREWFNYCNLLNSKFKRTTQGICAFVSTVTANDNSSDIAYKYCVNGGKDQLNHAQSELSLSFLSQDDKLELTSSDGVTSFEDKGNRGGYIHVNQIFDYIPKNLIEGSTDDTTPEVGSDTNNDVLKYDNSSEQDEISIRSHPLIWDAMSSDGFDINNNSSTTTSSLAVGPSTSNWTTK